MSAKRRLREESGLTLIELLVAISISVGLLGALFTIIDVSMRVTTRIADQADANRSGRAALTKIEQLLGTSCLTSAYAPIQSVAGNSAWQSTPTQMAFIAGFGSGLVPGSVAPVLHVIQLTNTTNGNLVDTTYARTGGNGTSASPWTFSNSGTAYTLIEHVSEAADATDGTTLQPVFTYYQYSNNELPLFSSPSGNTNLPYSATQFWPPDPAGEAQNPLSAADAGKTAEVTIHFKVLPRSGVAGTNNDRTVTMSDAVVLRFTASAAAGSSAPCD